MTNLMNTLYGPLPVKYCLYYYILSIITFLSFLVALGNLLLNLIRRKIDGTVILQLNLIIITFVGYFTNRLLYSMCAGSLK
jgi:hypothetical protein